MKNLIEIKQIISMAIIRKKTPAEIVEIISGSISDYNNDVKKLIKEIKTLNLTDVQKEKIMNLENYNIKDCQEDEETLKYLALSQYEMKKEETIDRLETIIYRKNQENKKIEKDEKKINYREMDNAIVNKKDNFNFANIIINSVIDEIKSSKKGIQNNLKTIKFLEEQQEKIYKALEQFDVDVALTVNNTILKKTKVEQALDIQDLEICREVTSSIKEYIGRGQVLNQSSNFQNKRKIFVENLYEGISKIKSEEHKQIEEKDSIKEIELDEK